MPVISFLAGDEILISGIIRKKIQVSESIMNKIKAMNVVVSENLVRLSFNDYFLLKM